MDGSYTALEHLGVETTGRVRWFDEKRGFGFVVCDETATDILLHESVVQAYGQSSIATGMHNRVRAAETLKGRRATVLLEVGMGAHDYDEAISCPDPSSVTLGAHQPARVKWFSEESGYGFVNVFGDPQDYFIHHEQVEEGGFKSLQTGEAVSVIVAGDRSAVLEITRWLRL